MADELAAAEKLYSEAVHETPPNRTKLDELVDLLCANPRLLYDGFFKKAHEAASIVVDVCHGLDDAQEDDNLSILTPPAAWGWTVMEETVCHAPPAELMETVYPQLAQQFLELADRTLEHMETTPVPIVRSAVQALTRFWPEIIRACISRSSGNPDWKKMYSHMLKLADTVTLLPERTDDPALLARLAKFLETEATIFTAVAPASDSKRDVLSLGMLPAAHPYIFKSRLAQRGEAARQQLLRLLPSGDHTVRCNTSFITAIINSIVYLMNLRPQFCESILERLTDWYAAINASGQTLTDVQLTIIGKALRIALLHLYTRRYMGAYSEILEKTLDQIGGPEWSAWQEQQARNRERRERQRAREREQMARQQQKQKEDEEAHSARWVPAPEEGDVDMADQPAPGAGGAGDVSASVPPPPPPPLSARGAPGVQRQRPTTTYGHKRTARQAADDADEDEGKLSRMLEENAKRVKLDESMDADDLLAAAEPAAPAAPAAPTEEQLRALEADKAMEDEMRTALQSEPLFSLPVDEMSPSERRAQVESAIRRVIDGKVRLEKFLAHKRAVDGAVAAGAVPRVLPGGQSTNSGVLEDSMVMLVRLVTNCYVLHAEANQAKGTEDAASNTQWAGMHACVDEILKLIVDAPRERYSLALILLYELWMAVVITDPDLARMPDITQSDYTLLALYLRWCERIFDAIVKYS
ncbi:hypothetical protein H4R18_005074, partial [Coemansia javaensis]